MDPLTIYTKHLGKNCSRCFTGASRNQKQSGHRPTHSKGSALVQHQHLVKKTPQERKSTYQYPSWIYLQKSLKNQQIKSNSVQGRYALWTSGVSPTWARLAYHLSVCKRHSSQQQARIEKSRAQISWCRKNTRQNSTPIHDCSQQTTSRCNLPQLDKKYLRNIAS